MISIHALLAESDFPTVSSLPRAASFLSTLSLRRATYDLHGLKMGYCISIHALLAESDLKFTRLFYDLFISIHALLAESDVLEEDFPVDSVTISIHALLAESDQAGIADVTQRLISIHALLAESDVGDTPPCCGCMISIHALLAESDCWCWEPGTVTARFLSTLSLRRATRQCRVLIFGDLDFYPRSPCGERRRHYPAVLCQTSISIHALLAESDLIMVGGCRNYMYFYPRSPCGERQLTLVQGFLCWIFLSTLSLRRATLPLFLSTSYSKFLSTLSLRRATARSRRPPSSKTFLSTLSLRRATGGQR